MVPSKRSLGSRRPGALPLLVLLGPVVDAHLASLQQFPPRQKGGTLTGPARPEVK